MLAVKSCFKITIVTVFLIVLFITAQCEANRVWAPPKEIRKIRIASPLTTPSVEIPIILNLMDVGGFSSDEGIDIEIVGLDPTEIPNAIKEETVDIATLRFLTALTMNIDLKGFMIISKGIPYPWIIAVKHVDSIEDLIGKKVAVTNFDFSTGLVPVEELWEPYGVDPQEWIRVDSPSDRVEALLNREVDAVFLPPYEALQILKTDPELHKIPFPSLGNVFLDYWDFVLMAEDQFLIKEKETLIALARALLRTMGAVNNDKELWTELMLKVMPGGDKEIVEEAWGLIRENLVLYGMLSIESFDTFVDVYYSKDVLPKPYVFSEVINPEVVNEASYGAEFSFGEWEIYEKVETISDQLDELLFWLRLLTGVVITAFVIPLIRRAWAYFSEGKGKEGGQKKQAPPPPKTPDR